MNSVPTSVFPRQTLVQTRESREGQENELETLATKLADLHVPWTKLVPVAVQQFGGFHMVVSKNSNLKQAERGDVRHQVSLTV